MVHIYGIKNCNTIKKTLDWFTEKGIEFTFHDYKKEPASEEKIKQWQSKADWELLINKRGTSWRKLTEEEKAKVIDAPSAIPVMLQNNSLIKRPVIEYNQKLLIGFDEAELTDTFRS